MEDLPSLGPFRFKYLEGEGEGLVISFASIGHDPARAPSPEFVGTASRGPQGRARRALFVMDEGRTWASDPRFAEALIQAYRIVEGRGAVGLVTAIGLSMGGFAALAASHVLPIDGVLAFGPQYSVRPEVVPEEKRWRAWSANVVGPMNPVARLRQGCKGLICHGALDDWEQARRFAETPEVDHLIFPTLGHSDLVPHLKSRGVLGGLLDAFIEGDRRRYLRILASASGVRRARYKRAL